jgi:large subunit ribosomal protein L17
MRHSVFGRGLSRTKNERRRLLQGLARDVIIRGSIKTSLAKAKAVQPMVEKLVTLAKKGSVREVKKIIASKDIEKLLNSDAGTRFANRSSGFTRIIKLGKRLGDATEVVFLQFVDTRVTVEAVEPKMIKKVIKKKV